MHEIVELKAKISELEEQGQADQELMGALRERQMQLEAEIQEYKEIAEQTCNVRTLKTKFLCFNCFVNGLSGERTVEKGLGSMSKRHSCQCRRYCACIVTVQVEPL